MRSVKKRERARACETERERGKKREKKIEKIEQKILNKLRSMTSERSIC